MNYSSVLRQRYANEIVPNRAEQSHTLDDNESLNGAGNAIDMNLETGSYAFTKAPDASNTTPLWLKIILDQVHCVHQVIWDRRHGPKYHVWTCNSGDCNTCSGQYCYTRFNVDVLTEEGGGAQQSGVSDCKYGDTVKMDFIRSYSTGVDEMAIIERQLGAVNIKVYNFVPRTTKLTF